MRYLQKTHTFTFTLSKCKGGGFTVCTEKIMLQIILEGGTFFQPLSVHGWTSVFLLNVHRVSDAIEGRFSHLLPRWLWNTLPRLGIEPGLRWGQTVRYIQSPVELSWRGPRRGQTGKYIHSPTALSWPRPQGGQTVRYIHSPTELSWPGPGEDSQWDLFILPLSYHDLGLERTDSEIHSFSHWAIMAWAWRGQTVRYIHSPTELSWLPFHK